jgi:heme-degrading monooxygenase HmoA
MFCVVWEFRVKPDHVAEFERHYQANGTWASLFRQDPAYQETVLLRDLKTEGRYLTKDFWQDESSYRSFQERFAERYATLDSEFAAFTESEQLIGYFEVMQ